MTTSLTVWRSNYCIRGNYTHTAANQLYDNTSRVAFNWLTTRISPSWQLLLLTCGLFALCLWIRLVFYCLVIEICFINYYNICVLLSLALCPMPFCGLLATSSGVTSFSDSLDHWCVYRFRRSFRVIAFIRTLGFTKDSVSLGLSSWFRRRFRRRFTGDRLITHSPTRQVGLSYIKLVVSTFVSYGYSRASGAVS